MTFEQKVLVENDLVTAILAFHDIDDKKQREKNVRNYFFSFCRENNIIEADALNMIEKALKDKRKTSMYKYEYYTNLKEILYPRKVDLDSDGR